MKLTSKQVEELELLRKKNKFSEQEWAYWNLAPSDKQTCERMNRLMNQCLDELLKAEGAEAGLDKEDFSKIMDRGLKKFKRAEYDTEEGEIIVETFLKVATLLGIDYMGQLSNWMYGELITSFSKRIKKEEKAHSTHEIQCAKCGQTLTEKIISVEEGEPSYWSVVKCSNCTKKNVFPSANNANEIRYSNCTWVESLPFSEYDHEQIQKLIKD